MRPATIDDAQRIADLINICDESLGMEAEASASETTGYWKASPVDLQNNTWMVIAPDGTLAGYQEVIPMIEQRYFILDSYFHPAYEGVGAALLDAAENRVRGIIAEYPGQTFHLQSTFMEKDTPARDLLASNGYAFYKADFRMEIALEAEPAAPTFPPGIILRTFVPEQDERAVYHVVHTAFLDIVGYAERAQTFEQWRAFTVERDDFDPTMLLIAQDESGAVVGVCLCPNDLPIGWVRQLAVLPSWRGKGLGVALLQQAFVEWYRRGKPVVGLAVQGDNDNAQRLYNKVGMSAKSRFDTYRKAVQAG